MTQRQVLLQVLAPMLVLASAMQHAQAEESAPLTSLSPEAVLDTLDLSRPGLEEVRAKAEACDRAGALAALLGYYRNRYPLPAPGNDASGADTATADNIVRHIFQWGPYESAQYGDDVRWDWDPRGDIEWVAAIYRFYWATPLVQAYLETRDEKYAQAFVDLTRDWIAKHPLQKHEETHYVYTHWKGFAWLDIQTGIRATNLCQAFRTMVHAKAFTPEFLGVFLASLYDHQVKTERLPMGKVHNKAVFEQRGFINIAYTFPEFKDARRWMTLALERTSETFLAQVTTDGVQREWSGGYHSGVLRDAVEIMGRMNDFDIPVPEAYRERVRRMYDYIFGIATPDLGYPMFGDTSRHSESSDRTHMQLYASLMQATDLFGDPKYAARATLDAAALPAQTCYAFREAGMYALRDAWGPDQIYFALHCSPPAISSHDQPDNGTFELCAYGRWLMNDTGYYTYGHDPEARAWHRQTRVHQTLTLDEKDSRVDGKNLLWSDSPGNLGLTVENNAYEGLRHRRTVWFVDKAFFVMLDEAIGEAPGALDLHFQFAPGEVSVDTKAHRATTCFDDANVLVWQAPEAPVSLTREDGWFAWTYGQRLLRTALRFRHAQSAPAAFLTVLAPYRGTTPPEVSASLATGYQVGDASVCVEASAFGGKWTLRRNLDSAGIRIEKTAN